MALIKEISQENGTLPDYWRIKQIIFDNDQGQVNTLWQGYLNADFRESNPDNPIVVKWIQTDLDKSDSDPIMAMAYELNKKTDMFAEAIDG